MKHYISIDIGGTAIKYGLIDENAQILLRKERETEAYKGGPAILQKVIEIIEELIESGKERTEADSVLSGVCISTAGMVDTKKGEIFYAAPLIPNYIGTNFKEAVKTQFQLPCEVENDVNCAGLAEYMSGASAGSQSALMLTIGTGIGGSLVIDGEVFHGFSGSACEVGYMHMGDSDFQTLGATSILTKKVAKAKKEKEENWNGYHIFEEAKKGDEQCIQAIDEMVDVLGCGIANICYVANPEIVVLGGGIMAQEEYLKERMEKALLKYLVPGIAKYTKIAFAKHRNDAGMMGAFYHFQNCQKN